jgi:hypothetical protein
MTVFWPMVDNYDGRGPSQFELTGPGNIVRKFNDGWDLPGCDKTHVNGTALHFLGKGAGVPLPPTVDPGSLPENYFPFINFPVHDFVVHTGTGFWFYYNAVEPCTWLVSLVVTFGFAAGLYRVYFENTPPTDLSGPYTVFGGGGTTFNVTAKTFFLHVKGGSILDATVHLSVSADAELDDTIYWVIPSEACVCTPNLRAVMRFSTSKIEQPLRAGIRFSTAIETESALFLDTFTDADATDITAHTPDSGGMWSEPVGHQEISGNQLTSTYIAQGFCLIDVGVSDCTVSAEFWAYPGGYPGIVFRAADWWHCWILRVTGSSSLEIVEFNGTFSDNVRASASVTLTAGDVISIVLSGDDVQGQINGVDVSGLSYNSAALNSETQIGIRSVPGIQIDNLKVTVP